jgi:hypothetical protein
MLMTPDWPVISLLNALPEPLKENSIVWEPACGTGNIVNLLKRTNQKCIGTDLSTGVDFLESNWPTENFDYIITNPPFSLKDQFLKKCYEYKKPFALLLPITAFDGKERRAMFKEHGMQLLVLPKRVDFAFPDGTYKGKPHFFCSWFTWGFNFDRDITYA